VAEVLPWHKYSHTQTAEYSQVVGLAMKLR